MRALSASSLILTLVAGWTFGADRKDNLFASWQDAQRDAQSLIVEFTLKTRDLITEETRTADGALRLVRTPKGEVFASYELTQQGTKDSKPARFTGLLNNGKIYVLNHDTKTAVSFDFADGELRMFLQNYFNPFVRLLDRIRAEEECKIEVVKQDDWYTYLAVKPKKVRRFGWFPDMFQDGRVVLMNKASDAVPQNMPRQFWYTDGNYDNTFEIKSWRLNPTVPPKLEEFAKPEDRPGWKVRTWNKVTEKDVNDN